jgi:hypothetical protein
MKIRNDQMSLEIGNKFFSIMFWKQINLRNWGIRIPKYTNWSRFDLNTPFFDFYINGWLFFGKKPQ